MATNKLFGSWTWTRKFPEPFDDPSIDKDSTDHVSSYNLASAKKSTLHCATLCGILAYMELEEAAASGSTGSGAIGTQGDMLIAEYPSRTGAIQAVVFNKLTGRFSAGKFTAPGDAPQQYILKGDKDSGSALFFALIPLALEDDEFQTEYGNLLALKKAGYTDLEETARCGYILCDNLYRRIENAGSLGAAGIKAVVPTTGNMPPFTAVNLSKGAYSPSQVLYGDFQILTPGAAPAAPAVATAHADFVGKYAFADSSFTEEEKAMIPQLPEWYVIPQEVVRICQHIQKTTGTTQPMRNFLLRGPAGTGKTEAAKAIAAGLQLPYTHITCSANTEIFDFLGQILPDIDGMPSQKSHAHCQLPTLEDIQMDPASAYYSLTGEYRDSVTESEVYDKLLDMMEAKARECGGQKEDTAKQKFRYVDTPLVKAMRYGYLCEIQEPTVIANPGVLVGLNSLLDRCSTIELPTGEQIHRHPNTVLVVTTNHDYAGCKDINQSVISRMNLVMDIEQPEIETMVERVCGITGCKDITAVHRMAEAVDEIALRCKETMITDGSCGMRELIAWVQSYMICENELEAARYTVLSSVSGDPENRAEIFNTCLAPKFDAV